MANRYATATGNWSNPAIWDGGTLPQTTDTVRPNGFTVTIDVDVTCLEVTNDANAPAVAGGLFTLTTGRTYNFDWTGGNGQIFSNVGAITCTINGNYRVIGGGNTNGVLINGGVVTLNGNNLGSSGARVPLVVINSGTLVCNGNIIKQRGLFESDSLRVNGGTVYVNGNVGGGNSSTAYHIRLTGGTVYVNGIVTGLLDDNTMSISSATQGMVNGIVIGSSDGSGAGAICSSNNLFDFTNVSYGINGSPPVVGTGIRFSNSGPNTVTITQQNGSTQTLVDPSTGFPATTDVRDGVTYASGGLTGTLVVPAANTVSLGIVYDNGTTGTAQNTAASFLAEIASSSDPLAERLRNVSTVSSTAATIASYNV